MTARERTIQPGAVEPARGDACVTLNDLLETSLAAERRCVASSGRAHEPALKAELVLRAAEHAGDAQRLHAALVFMRCTPHAPDGDAALNDPLWSTPPLSQADDTALLRGCIAEELENAARFEAALQLSQLPNVVRATLELCREAARHREAALRRLLPPMART